jgi:hypothetical protein
MSGDGDGCGAAAVGFTYPRRFSPAALHAMQSGCFDEHFDHSLNRSNNAFGCSDWHLPKQYLCVLPQPWPKCAMLH